MTLDLILVDTSVWVNHFIHLDPSLLDSLNSELVLMHPFVFGEISCGSLRDRALILKDLSDLPRAALATHEETVGLMESHKLWARGVGWVDMHLLASALLSKCQFWTHDVRLQQAASHAGVPLYSRTH